MEIFEGADRMNGIKKAQEKDAANLEGIIGREFAYKKLDKEKIIERMKRPEITVFKKVMGSEFAGFVEIEMWQDVGMINAISVKEQYRRKGFGRELLEYAIEFIRENSGSTARLLVKKGNERAKKLYSSCGFEFLEMHDKKIGGVVAEVWKKQLVAPDEQTGYLN